MQCMSHRNEWDLSNSSILNFSTKESQFTSFTFFPLPQVFLLWFPALMTWILDSFNLLSSFHHRLYVTLTATIVFLLMMILLLPWFALHFLFFLTLLTSAANFHSPNRTHFSFQYSKTLLHLIFPFQNTPSASLPCTQSEVVILMLRSSASDTYVLFRSSWPHGICLDFQLWIQCHSVVIFMFHYFDTEYSSLCYIQ